MKASGYDLRWNIGRLGDFLTLKRGYDLPKGRRSGGIIPVVSSSGVSDYHSVAMAKGPGVVTGRYGTIGEVFYIDCPFWPLNTALYVSDFKGNDPRFVSYLLRTLDFLAYSDKGAVPGINRNHLHEALITFPIDINEQRAISSILGALDDKIELNRKMSATLEAIARALFKSWFVDFDPVHAKAEGRDPGLPAEIAALFPNSFKETAHGQIPSGWSSACVGDYATLDKGLSYKGQYLSDNGVPMVNLACFIGDGIFDADRVKGYSGEYKSRHIIKDGDLVLANTDITQKRLVLGSPGIVRLSTAVDALFTHHTYALRFFEDSESMRYFFYHLFLQDRFRYRAMGYATGTTVLALPADAILEYEIVLPTTNVRAAFDDLNVPLRARQRIADREARILKALRDALLPKLISGELRVSDAERILAASA